MATSQILATSLPDRKGYTYRSLLNPLSALTGGGDRIPGWAMRMFPGNPEAAWMTAKVGVVGLEAALLAAAYRGIQHINTMSELNQTDDPDKKMEKEIGTTFNVNFADNKKPKPEGKSGEDMKKAAAQSDIVKSREVEMPGVHNIVRNSIYTGLPLAAMVLAAAAGYSAVDNYSDKKLNKVVTQSVQDRNRTMKNLMQARARVAKGTITDEEIAAALADAEVSEPYVKQAAEREGGVRQAAKAVVTTYGLLAMALFLASTGASYQYFKASDKNNIRYKAMKKGLMEYTKNKVVRAPINMVPTGQDEFFDTINNGAKKEAPAEEQPVQAPQVTNDVRSMSEVQEPLKPISVTL